MFFVIPSATAPATQLARAATKIALSLWISLLTGDSGFAQTSNQVPHSPSGKGGGEPVECVIAAEQLVGWWKLDGNGQDSVSLKPGSVSGNPQFENGRVGQGMRFDGTDDQIKTASSPRLNVGAGDGVTLELWIQPSILSGYRPILEWNNWTSSSQLGAFMWHSLDAPGSVYLYLPAADGAHEFVTPPNTLQTGVWQHLAFTYDRVSGMARLYVNGALIKAQSLGSFHPLTSGDLFLGVRPDGPEAGSRFAGLLDEVSVYSRSLTSTEIQEIYAIGAGGKCPVDLPFEILTHPQDARAFVGDNVTLAVTAFRAETYQWLFNDQEISGETNSSLTLTQVQAAQAGRYAVHVAGFGSELISEEAVLTVLDAPECASVSGATFWLSLEGQIVDQVNDNQILSGGNPTFGAGKVGQGLVFDGFNDQVEAIASPSVNVGSGEGLTLEFWIRPADFFSMGPIIEWKNPNIEALGLAVWHSFFTPGDLFIHLPFDGGPINLQTPGAALEAKVWQHLAFTYDRASGVVRLYHNGQLLLNQVAGSFHLITSGALLIGASQAGFLEGVYFKGMLDEVTLFARALSPLEVDTIFRAGAGGKCRGAELQIVSQPESLSAFAGQNATFRVVASGAHGYQWLFQGQALADQTNSTLSLLNLQPTMGGTYQVRVLGDEQDVLSAEATLTVLALPECAPVLPGLVGWWKLDENTIDQITLQPGTLRGGPDFDAGHVGHGLRFNRNGDGLETVTSSSLNVGEGDGFTIELWVRPSAVDTGGHPLCEWNDWETSGELGTFMWHSFVGAGSIYIYLPASNGVHQFISPTGVLQAETWQHLAFTYDRVSGIGRLYRNSELAHSQNLGSFYPDTRGNLNLGVRRDGPQIDSSFEGTLDEFSVYNRALTPLEVAGLYLAGAHGKCVPPTDLRIFEQPTNQTAFEGGSARLAVVAVGMESFQWLFQGQTLIGQTNARLVLENVVLNQAGVYSVRVMKGGETLTSQEVTLTVIELHGCAPISSALAGWWRLNGSALDEVSLTLGAINGNPAFPEGQVGQAMSFDGANDSLTAAASSRLNVGAGDGLTLEFWIQPSILTDSQPVCEWNNWQVLGKLGLSLWHSFRTPGNVYVNLPAGDTIHEFVTEPNILERGVWQHLAFTYERLSGRGLLYKNGILVHAQNLGSFHPDTLGDLSVGVRRAGPQAGSRFAGLLDEFSVHGRALSPQEIETIYRLGAGGKCPITVDPLILMHPEDVTALAGDSAQFNVLAVTVDSYQWLFEGQELSGQTNATLLLENIGPSHAGSYSVRVTGGALTLTSGGARLTVAQRPECAPTGPALVGWWKLNGNALDEVTLTQSVLGGNPKFPNGKVIKGMDFDGIDDELIAPTSPLLNVGAGDGLSVEVWIQPSTLSGFRPVMEWNNWEGSRKLGSFIWHSFGAPGNVYVYLPATDGYHEFVAPANTLQAGVWQHLAFTYDRVSGRAQLYKNGSLVQARHLGSFHPDTVGNLAIGVRPGGPEAGSRYAGLLDELSVYSYALTSAEVAAIYHAGTGGKCAPSTDPAILKQPQDVVVFEGEPAQFTVVAVRIESFQWLFEGQELSGETNTTLFLGQAELSQAGDYAVHMTGAGQTILSATATLTVTDLPDCAPTDSSLVAWWKLDGNAVDEVLSIPGSLSGNPQFQSGQVAQAMSFDGVDDQLGGAFSPLLNVGAADGLTVEFWIQPSTLSGYRPVMEWNDWDASGKLRSFIWHSFGAPGNVYISLPEANGYHEFVAPANTLQAEVWQHVAFTYDRVAGIAQLYKNGTLAHEQNLGSFHPDTMANLYLGVRPSGPEAGSRFAGLLDEFSIYSKALTSSEIELIYRVGSKGKCPLDIDPTILTQPEDVQVYEGGSARLTVLAVRMDTFQWLFEGQELPDQTNTTLLLSNVQVNLTGHYSVRMTVGGQTFVSDTAQLSVTAVPDCAPTGAQFAGWWKFNGNAADEVTATVGALEGNPEFQNGRVGQAMNFDGVDDQLKAASSPSLNVGAGDGLTVEFWIQPFTLTGFRPVVEWNDWTTSGRLGSFIWHSFEAPGNVYVSLPVGNQPHEFVAPANTLQAGVWQHLAFTYDRLSGIAQLYRNGILAHQQNLGSFHPDTLGDVSLGVRPAGPEAGSRFAGLLDEFSIYGRALTILEIETIYQVGARGKCALSADPTIVTQPQDVNIFAGDSAHFNVVALGMDSFQWLFEDQDLDGQTNATLLLNNVGLNQAGHYSVRMTTGGQTFLSETGLLAVVAVPDCTPAPTQLVAWFRLNGDALDEVSSLSGTFGGNPQFQNGRVGPAVNFDGLDDQLSVPASTSLNVGAGDGLTMEFWIQPSSLSGYRPVMNWDNWATSRKLGSFIWHSFGAPGNVYVYLPSGNQPHEFVAPANTLQLGVWQHIAFTYDRVSGDAKLYKNGALAHTQNLGAFHPDTLGDLYLGVRPSGPEAGSRYAGLLDEFSLYGRALTASEIDLIYRVNAGGKCPLPPDPIIVTQPQDLSVIEGQSAPLAVVAVNMDSFQWLFEGQDLPGQTNSILLLSNVALDQAGHYSVRMTSTGQTFLSETALLTVIGGSECAPTGRQLTGWWKLNGNSMDEVASVQGTFGGNPEFPSGQVGQAMNFDGIDDQLTVPASALLNVGAGDGFTVEFWIKPSVLSGFRPVLEWNNYATSGRLGSFIWHSFGAPGNVYVYLPSSEGVHEFVAPANTLQIGVWQHLAFAYDRVSGIAQLYKNGVLAHTQNLGSFHSDTVGNLSLGVRPSGPEAGARLAGLLDELALYSRALASSEIVAIHQVGTRGKCPLQSGPQMVTPPEDLNVFEGESAQISVLAVRAEIQPSGGTVVIALEGEVETTYDIEVSEDLQHWQNAGPAVRLGGNLFEARFPADASSCRFYRAVVK